MESQSLHSLRATLYNIVRQISQNIALVIIHKIHQHAYFKSSQIGYFLINLRNVNFLNNRANENIWNKRNNIHYKQLTCDRQYSATLGCCRPREHFSYVTHCDRNISLYKITRDELQFLHSLENCSKQLFTITISVLLPHIYPHITIIKLKNYTKIN